MSTDGRLERLLDDLLDADAPSRAPDRLRVSITATTGPLRPRPRWLAMLKEPPMRMSSRVVVGSPTVRSLSILAATVALILAVAAAGAAATSLLQDPVPPPFGPAGNGVLAYDQGGDIYLVDGDGANVRPIVTGDTNDRYPWFSHDGTRILFGRGEDADLTLVLANADGSEQRELVGGAEWAEFMPADDEVVLTRTVDGQAVLSMIDLSTGAVRDLDVGELLLRSWVMPRPPDGRELLFLAADPGTPDRPGLFGIAPDGTGLRAIGAIAPEPTTSDSFSFGDPSLSSDGTKMAYWGWEIQGDLAEAQAYAHLRDLDTGDDSVMAWATNAFGIISRFSPDSTMIVVEAWARPDSPGLHKLYVAPVDGSRPGVPITDTFGWSARQAFDFSPDGTKVLLTLSGKTSIVDVATGAVTKVDAITNIPTWQRVAR